MATEGVDCFFRRLARGMAAERFADLTDRQLVERLSDGPDGAAFEALVRRHGAMVYRVCWRVLQQAEDAEDAFQATFLLLAQKLTAVRKKESLASWLHGVAHRVALDARKRAARRRRHEGRAAPSPADGAEWCDVRAALDEELAALPEAHRLPLVLCYLEAQTQDEAARQLGWSKSTLLRRLSAARAALGRRLACKGFAWSSAGAAVLLADAVAPAAPSLQAVHTTVEAAVAALSGRSAAGLLTANALDLIHGARSTMFMTKLKRGLAALVVATSLAGAGYLGLPATSATPRPAQAGPKPEPAPVAALKPVKGPNMLLLGLHDRLSLIAPAGKDRKELLTARPALDGVRLAPDGERVAYVANDPNAKEPSAKLHLAALYAKQGEMLDVSPRSFAWSPDGAAVAYSEFPEPGKMSARHGVLDAKTHKTTVLKLPEDHYITDWSRDGKFFVTTRVWPRAGVFLMNQDGTEHKSLTEKRLQAGRYGVAGRLSPDGKRLLFKVVTPRRKGDKETKVELAVLDLATGKVTPVADVPPGGEVVHAHCWSPDGKRIAYAWSESLDRGPDDDIESRVIVCDPDGKNAKAISSSRGRLVTIVGVDWK